MVRAKDVTSKIAVAIALLTAVVCGPMISPLSGAAAATLLGDRIAGAYNFPCVGCDPNLLPPVLTGGTNYIYSTNPFVVTPGDVETVLTVNPGHGDFTTNVMFTGNSLILTITKDVFYIDDPFSGPVFTVLTGRSFGSITGVQVNRHCTPCSPIDAFLSGNSLFINWQGGGGIAGDTIEVDFSVGDPINPSPVPLPAALPLFATGLSALGLLAWRRRRKAGA